ncbi:hypothetical protein [Stieleria varia]|uniref:Uncharacterized protein n=1 Tax=Stieleria varia TaxID=2528005 RepID=A0A5C6A488_9BACT|nr:hypothetical protein [Stieleria varia]TWT94734.1 hypothetical protein Pla52n_55590 [Stieleria varia]
MPPRLHKRLSSAVSKLVLLSVVLWAAPVPMGHCHSDGGLGWSEQQMALHLQTCHGGLANADDWPSGWHWHWVLRMDTVMRVTDIGGDDSGSRALCIPSLDNMNFAASDHPCESKLDAWIWQSSIISPPVPMNHRHSFTTTGLLAFRHSLPELLGVIRC